ncbi:hypothetical protein ACQP3F_29770 [Escherichia coli]
MTELELWNVLISAEGLWSDSAKKKNMFSKSYKNRHFSAKIL